MCIPERKLTWLRGIDILPTIIHGYIYVYFVVKNSRRKTRKEREEDGQLLRTPKLEERRQTKRHPIYDSDEDSISSVASEDSYYSSSSSLEFDDQWYKKDKIREDHLGFGVSPFKSTFDNQNQKHDAKTTTDKEEYVIELEVLTQESRDCSTINRKENEMVMLMESVNPFKSKFKTEVP